MQVVIQDKTYYRMKILKILSDETYYKLLMMLTLTTNHIEHYKILQNTQQITKKKKKKKFWTDYFPQTSNFYGLPKVHKSEKIKKSKRNTKHWIYNYFKP